MLYVLARILIAKPVSTLGSGPRACVCELRKQNRRQPLASVHGCLVGAAPRLEELHQLFSRGVLVPFVIAFDDVVQFVGRLRAVSLRAERCLRSESGSA